MRMQIGWIAKELEASTSSNRSAWRRIVRTTALLCLVANGLAWAQTPNAPVRNGRVRLKVAPGKQLSTSAPAPPQAQFSIPPGFPSFVVPPGVNAANPAGQQHKTSLSHLYWHFLAYQNHLDRAAAAHESQGKDGKWLRNHFQTRLGFTDAQFAPVRAAAQRLEPELGDIKAKALVIVKADRQWARANPGAGRPPLTGGNAATASATLKNAPAPPGRAQLRDLQAQYEATIQHEIETLKQAIGPAAAAKLDTFLQDELARQVTSIHFQPGQLRNFRTPAPREAQP